MTGRAPPTAADDPDTRALEQLLTHVEWADGPWVAFVFTPSAARIHPWQERTAAATSAQRVWRPSTPQELREVLPRLLTETDDAALTWVEAVRRDPGGAQGGPWTEAWDQLLLRANERRELVKAAAGGGLILVAPPELKPRFSRAAPDLWSIRALVLELDPHPMPDGDGPAPEPWAHSTAHRTALAVLRLRYHLAVERSPWVAVLVAPTDAALERLHTAAAELGARTWRGELPEPGDLTEDTGLHWVAADGLELEPVRALLSGSAPAGILLAGRPGLEQRVARQVGPAAFTVRLHRTSRTAPLPTLDEVERLVTGAAEAIARARELQPAGPGARMLRVRALSVAVESLLLQGWVTEAAPLVEDLCADSEALYAERPGETTVQALAEARLFAGDVARAQGDLAAAREAYAGARDLRAALSAQARGAARYRRLAELARCDSLLGALALAFGDLGEAQRALEASRAARAEVAAWSGDDESRSALALSMSLLGDLHLARGALEAAGDAYRDALQLRRELAEESGARRHQRMLSIAWGRLGRWALRSGNVAGARAAWTEARSLTAAIARSDPGNVGWQMEDSIAASRLGDAARAEGDTREAEAAYASAVDTRARLVAEDPENARWQEYLAVALGRLADALADRGALDEAARHAARAEEISAGLAWQEPAHVGWHAGLATARLRRGALASARGCPAEAADHDARAADAALELAAQGTEEALRRARAILDAVRKRARCDPEAVAHWYALLDGAT